MKSNDACELSKLSSLHMGKVGHFLDRPHSFPVEPPKELRGSVVRPTESLDELLSGGKIKRQEINRVLKRTIGMECRDREHRNQTNTAENSLTSKVASLHGPKGYCFAIISTVHRYLL